MRGYLFFDLDGTIADSGTQIRAALDEVLVAHGGSPLTDMELFATIGPPMQTSIPPLLRSRGLNPELMQQVINEYRAVYKAKHLPQTPLNSGMAEALETLSEHWALAVVTSKPEPQAVIAVEATGTAHLFTTVVGPEADNPVHKSVLLERAIFDMRREHGREFHPELMWMIGDRHHDIDAAVVLGTRSIGVMWGYGSHDELTSAGAHAIAHDPEHMVEILLSY